MFLARVTGEQMGLPGAWAAVLISLAFGLAGGWALSRWPLTRTWPALILLGYVFYPEPYFPHAATVAITAALAFILNEFTLRDPLSFHAWRLAWIMALVLTGGFFSLYLSTLAPGVLAADSGELQVVAAQLGVAHPPGFPLYVMTAHLFTRLFSSMPPAYAVNLFSALTSALTVGTVYLAVVALTRRIAAAVIAVVALGSATTFWAQATTANVRSLTGLFAALIFLSLIRFRIAVHREDRQGASRWLVAAALLMGFGVTHHVSLLFLSAMGLIFILAVDPSLLREPRRWPLPILASMLGLLPLLYLPLRASTGARGASPDLATWSGFLEHALATGFRGDLFYYLAPPDLWQRLRIMGNVMAFQFTPLILGGIVAGGVLVMMIRRERPIAFLLIATLAIYILVAATYRAPQTVEYMMPGYVAAALILGMSVGLLPDILGRFSLPGKAAGVFLAAALMGAATLQLDRNRTAAGESHEGEDARAFARTLLEAAPAQADMLAHWHWVTPLWYLQEIEGVRPDVNVQFVYPEGVDYDTTWERRIREALAGGRPVISTWHPSIGLNGLPAPEPVGEALLFPQEPRHEIPPDYTATGMALGEGVEVLGYRLNPVDRQLSVGEEAVIMIAWRARGESTAAGLFVHFVGPDNRIYGQDDRVAVPASGGITLTQFRVTTRPGTPPGRILVYIGSSENGNARELLAELDVSASSAKPYTRNKTHRAIRGENGRALIGYDWDHTVADRSRLYLHWETAPGQYLTQVVDDESVGQLQLAPYRGPWGVPVAGWRFPSGRDGGHYVPLGAGIVWTGETLNNLELEAGESIVLDQELHSGRPVNRDYVVSVRLIGLEGDGIHWQWWDLQDSVPAMGAIPTLKWIEGSFVRSPHRITVAETAAPGQALTGALTMYDAFTKRQLPILDERITAETPWIPLCRGMVYE